MPSWPNVYQSPVAAGVNVPNAAETVVATLGGVSMPSTGFRVILTGLVLLTTGATTTAVVVRVREDSLTGPVVGSAETDTAIGAAGSTDPYPFVAIHSPAGELANKTYVVTVQQTGGSSNGTAVVAELGAVVTL